MKSSKYVIIFLFCIIINSCYTQNEANIWYFGSYAGLDFNNGTPVALTDGAMDAGRGCATISDNNLDFLID